MSSCPKCSHSIGDPFGIVQCPNCKTMLVGDFDGNLKVSAEGAFEEMDADVLPDAPFSVVAPTPASIPVEGIADWNFDEAPAPSVAVEPIVEPAYSEIAEIEESPIQQQGEEKIQQPGVAQNFSDEIKEINNFANSEESRAREGILFYQLKISGIDSADLHAAVQDCLQDSKLQLNLKELFKSMRDGVLVVPKLNAVKASVIVSRLKEYSLDIQWSQMSLINSEVEKNATP